MIMSVPVALRPNKNAPRHLENREQLARRLRTVEEEALLARSGGATVMRIDEVLYLINGPQRLSRGSQC